MDINDYEPDLDEPSPEELAACEAMLPADQRVMVVDYWDRVIGEVFASVEPVIGVPPRFAGAASERRRLWRAARRASNATLRAAGRASCRAEAVTGEAA